MEEYEAPRSGRILVRPEALAQKSREFSGKCERLREVLEEIREAAEGTGDCFRGRSGERFRKKIENRKQEGEEIARELSALAAGLQEIADEYALAERENKDVFGGN